MGGKFLDLLSSDFAKNLNLNAEKTQLSKGIENGGKLPKISMPFIPGLRTANWWII